MSSRDVFDKLALKDFSLISVLSKINTLETIVCLRGGKRNKMNHYSAIDHFLSNISLHLQLWNSYFFWNASIFWVSSVAGRVNIYPLNSKLFLYVLQICKSCFYHSTVQYSISSSLVSFTYFCRGHLEHYLHWWGERCSSIRGGRLMMAHKNSCRS